MKQGATQQEQWKPIPEFPDYRISSHGRLRSFKWGRPRFLNPNVQSNGYLQVYLRRDGRYHALLVHRIVAQVFIGPAPSPQHQANHLDANRQNNRVDNLNWVTQAENNQHARELRKAG